MNKKQCQNFRELLRPVSEIKKIQVLTIFYIWEFLFPYKEIALTLKLIFRETKQIFLMCHSNSSRSLNFCRGKERLCFLVSLLSLTITKCSGLTVTTYTSYLVIKTSTYWYKVLVRIVCILLLHIIHISCQLCLF